MKSLPLRITGLLFSGLVSNAQAGEAYLGQFRYQYDGGSVYRVTVKDAQSMSWLCIEGDEKGAHGIETPQRFKVADKVYFASWVEKTGINVTQVINLHTMKVCSTITDGKQRFVISGNIMREQ